MDAGDLPDYLTRALRGAEDSSRGHLDRYAVEEVLDRHGGKRTRAARHLGVNRVTL